MLINAHAYLKIINRLTVTRCQIQSPPEQASAWLFRYFRHAVGAETLCPMFGSDLVQKAVGGAKPQTSNALVVDRLLEEDLHRSANIRTEYMYGAFLLAMRRKQSRIRAGDSIACGRFRLPCVQRGPVLPGLDVAHLQGILYTRVYRVHAIVGFVLLQ